ncbi:MAG: 6,7-dimethyl-8-ribityllumazine synthase [Hydrogenophilus sp.]|nr:6,7-dimethyl-8-ribityllumazine synthase [Hydrogenophilus sp.]
MARYDDIYEFESDFEGRGVRVGVAMARFNADVGDGLLSACIAELRALGVSPSDIAIVTVPGALELPIALQAMARSGRFDALVALGAVIRGETYHFEVVANEMAAGIMRVQLECAVPIANGVLTTDSEEQAEVRMNPKGRECARVAVEMANLLRSLRRGG